MSFHGFVAKRYLWSKRRHPFVGVVSTISVLGILVGVAALITVLGVMNGFDQELKTHILGIRAHLTVEKEGPFDNFTAAEAVVRRAKGVKGVSPYVEGQALLQVGEWGTGVLVRGIDVDTERNVSHFFSYLTVGTLSGRGTDGGVVVGSELAKRAHLTLGSEVRLATQNTEKPLSYRVEGIFSSGLHEYDANLIFLNLKNAQTLFDMPNAVSGLSVYVYKEESAGSVKQELQKTLGYPHVVRSWMDANRTLFSALKLEKTVMFLILALIILVACLNIAGCLTILVMNKTKDIGILKALGARREDLVKIFAWDGLALGLSGAFSGLLAGAGLCAVLKHTSLIELPKEIYYIDHLPVEMNAADTALVIGVAVLLSLLSALYPALVAGKLDAVKALRYE